MYLSNANLTLFVAIADQGSLSAAARQLGVQKSTVSRELVLLETGIGHRLVERTSRQMRLTEAGQLLLLHARRVIEEIAVAQASIEALAVEPTGRLKVSLPHAVAQKLVLPLLPAFLQRYPSIDVALDLSTRNVDLVAEGIDLALRIGELPPSSLIARKLGNLPVILVASPAYLARAGMPRSVEELAAHDIVALSTQTATHRWWFDEAEAHREVVIHPRITSTEVAVVRDLAVAGLGVASLPRAFVADDLAHGALARVLPDVTRGAPPIHVVYPSRQSLTPKTRVFIEAVLAGLSALER